MCIRDRANTFANIMMPVNSNLGNISYVLCAVLGAVLALKGFTGLTLGTLVSFLSLNKNFTQPVTQISQQMNSIVMAMAGADRVFRLLDAEQEVDNGYVELVNAEEQPDGSLTAVSYTHLDVYKRQGESNTGEDRLSERTGRAGRGAL